MSPTKRIIHEAQLLLQMGEWCQENYAKDAEGETVRISSPKAQQFCMTGAMYRAWRDLGVDADHLKRAYTLVRQALPEDRRGYHPREEWVLPTVGDELCDFNDDPKTTKNDVAELLSAAERLAV